MTDNITPPWAARVWCNGYTIFCELPGPNDTYHRIQVNNDIAGLSKIMIMLRTRDEGSRIGTQGDPTKLQVARKDFAKPKKRLKKPPIQHSSEQRNGTRQLLRKLGMI